MPDAAAPGESKELFSLAQILSKQTKVPKRAEPGNGAGADHGKKLKILVVEDERIVARDLQVRLTNLGYSLTGTASSKQEAILSAERERPDLVLMDIRLKGIPDGIDAAQELRSTFNLPVIYLTGHSDTATLARARTTEPFGYILKPFENRELVAAIETAVYKHEAETRLREANTRAATGATRRPRWRVRLEP